MGLILFLLVLAAVLVAWELGWKRAGVTPISPAHLEAMGKDPNLHPYLADVRTGFERRLFAIPGSHHHPELLAHPESLDSLPPDRPVVVLCLTGHRSSPTAWRLKHRGHTQVYSLTGGTLGWLITGRPTV